MISQFVSLSPTSGSVLTAQSPEPASDSVSPSLSAPALLTLCLSLSLSKKKNKHEKIIRTNNKRQSPVKNEGGIHVIHTSGNRQRTNALECKELMEMGK